MREEYKYKKFIVLDGIDGCGKTTQAELLVDRLNHQGENAVYIHFPSDDSIGKVLKEISHNKNISYDDNNVYAMSLMYAIDRYTAIKGLYHEYFYSDKGYTIIADRWLSSNLISQSSKIENPSHILGYRYSSSSAYDNYINYYKWLTDIEYNKLELPVPDRLILLDISFEDAKDRVLSRGSKDIYDREDILKKSYLCADVYTRIQSQVDGLHFWDNFSIKGTDTVAGIHNRLYKMIV